MNSPNIESHVQKFSKVVDRVLDNRRDLLSKEGDHASFASIAFAQNELSQLRDELSQPSRVFHGRTIVEHDYQAVLTYLSNDSVPSAIESIDVNQFGRVTQLAQSGGSHASLSGLELLTELRDVILIQVKVADCSSLSDLAHLNSLVMTGNVDLDLSTLGTMHALKVLDCEGSLVGELSWLSHCPEIKRLSAEHCDIYSLESLSGCRTLEVLEISKNPLQSLVGIEKLVALKDLSIENTQITDFSPLTILPLRELRVSEDMTWLPSFEKCLHALHKNGVAVTKVNEDLSSERI